MADPVPYSRDDVSAQPPTKFADFKASAVRAPSHPLIRTPHTLTEITGPSGDDIWEKLVGPAVTDLTRQHIAHALYERLLISRRGLTENERPWPHHLRSHLYGDTCR